MEPFALIRRRRACPAPAPVAVRARGARAKRSTRACIHARSDLETMKHLLIDPTVDETTERGHGNANGTDTPRATIFLFAFLSLSRLWSSVWSGVWTFRVRENDTISCRRLFHPARPLCPLGLTHGLTWKPRASEACHRVCSQPVHMPVQTAPTRWPCRRAPPHTAEPYLDGLRDTETGGAAACLACMISERTSSHYTVVVWTRQGGSFMECIAFLKLASLLM